MLLLEGNANMYILRVTSILIPVLSIGYAQAAIQIFHDPTVGITNQEAQESAFLSEVINVVLIDFEDRAPGPIIGDEYISLGVVFSRPGVPDTEPLVIFDGTTSPGITSRSNPNHLNTNETALPADASKEQIQFEFITPQTAVGFWLLDSEKTAIGEVEDIQFFDATDNLLTSIPMPVLGDFTGGPEANFFIGLTSDVPIGRVLINELPGETGGEENIAVDDVYLAVPEPTSLTALVGIGSITMIRRRRTASLS